MNEWYRKQTWTNEDEADFYLHLSRSKTEYHQAQYLKIQAFTLYETHKKQYFNAILSLLDQYFVNFSDDRFFRAECLHLYGRIFYDRRLYEKAFVYYQKSARQESEFPSAISGAWLDYAQIIVRLKRTERYEEAEKLLLSRYDSLLFPIELYRTNAVLAIIRSEYGDAEKAAGYKRLAQEAARMKTSALRQNPDAGVVMRKDKFLEKAMKKIPS